MFNINSKKIDFGKSNTLKRKDISLDENLDCFILVSGASESFVEVALNNILDAIAWNISKENTYKEFSFALENINAFIKTRNLDSKNNAQVDIIIWILEDDNFIFSNIWESSCCLIKNDNEIVELTNREENKKEFSFISSWELANWEIVLMSSMRIFDYLTNDDIIDGINEERDVNILGKNIKKILEAENWENNMILTALQYTSAKQEEKSNEIFTFCNQVRDMFGNTHILEYIEKIWDSLSLHFKKSSKNIKSIIFISWIIISLVLIYQVLSAVITATSNNNIKELAKTQLTEAKNYIWVASENIANKNNFDENIENALSLITQIEEKKIFLNDIEKIRDQIGTLRKQFNKVETFNPSSESTLYTWDWADSIKIIESNNKPFIINNKWVLWPILPNIEPKNYIFNSLESNEVFVDATALGNDIFLLTNFSKIVRFTKNWHFTYSDVIWQTSWEKASEIVSYGQNIYLLGKENSQIFRHTKNGTKFNSGKGYLKKDDLTQIWKIKAIAIDWGFYILKEDLSMLKFYSSPKYRLEKLVINQLPEWYNENSEEKIQLKTRFNLNYLYMLHNGKIWVLKPNSKDYRSTKSLTYIGQIEGSGEQIKDFFVNYDGEIFILGKSWAYKVNFEISDDKIILR